MRAMKNSAKWDSSSILEIDGFSLIRPLPDRVPEELPDKGGVGSTGLRTNRRKDPFRQSRNLRSPRWDPDESGLANFARRSLRGSGKQDKKPPRNSYLTIIAHPPPFFRNP